MTTSRRGGPSRAGSSRATSVVGETRKRREKPYKIESKKVLDKKKKLKIKTSYTQPPLGYAFLPVGTQDLAERCKELSRQRGQAVHVVNAKPVSKHAIDPEKVSHHIHRIGYHFKAEIVDQAREELGYMFYRGRFVKEADVQAQTQQSYIAAVMARNGIRQDRTHRQESPTQVRAAIKELFPKIPEEDLEQIVEHAWKEGSHRVGTNETMELPRRVQLATIARIRHQYTDYDSLLRAFEWKEARKEVEQRCLEKLIEWRGENDAEDDNELEEIVRETIVIDDDDEDNVIDLTSDGEADDEDSDAEHGDISDASVEFTHQLAVDEDLRPESVNETSKSFFERFQPWSRRIEQQNYIARQKLGEARRLLRRAPPAEAVSYARAPSVAEDLLTRNRDVGSVHVPMDDRGTAPNTVVIDGQLYLRESSPHHRLPAAPPLQYSDRSHYQHGPHHPMHALTGRLQPPPFAATQANDTDSHNRAIPSIEPHTPATIHERQPLAPLHGTVPPNPEYFHPEKRRRLDYSPNHLRPGAPEDRSRPSYPQWSHGRSPRTPPPAPDIVDLTTPERHSRSGNPSPMRDVQPAPVPYPDRRQYLPDPQFTGGNAPYDISSLRPSVDARASVGQYQQMPLEPVPYDPRQPMMHLPDREVRYDIRMVERDAYEHRSSGFSHMDGHLERVPHYEAVYDPQRAPQAYDRPIYEQSSLQEPTSRIIPVSTRTPQPVHGAPAPVQMALDGRSPGKSVIPNVQGHQPQVYAQQAPSHPPQPVYGAPHPAQYYVSR